MIPTCTRCASWIERSNHGHPGYCSPRCRDFDRDDRDEGLAAAAAKRRDQREQKQQRQPLVLT